MTPEELAAALDNPPYGDCHYKHPLGLSYTEGIKMLATEAKAYWLLDVICSYQPVLRKKARLADFHFWTVKHTGQGCYVICWEDTEKEVLRQYVPYTDFPQVDVKIYVEGGVMLLPSER
jgi:hypothetical protein